MINVTNDSWFDMNSQEPWQHLFLTRWVAIQFNMPIIRATNTGITVIIDQLGEINKRIENSAKTSNNSSRVYNVQFLLKIAKFHEKSLYF